MSELKDEIMVKIKDEMVESYLKGYDHGIEDTVKCLKECKEKIGGGAIFSLDDIIAFVSIGLKPVGVK